VKIRKWYIVATLLQAGVAMPVLAQTQPQTPPGMLPYTAILDPQFIPASQASFSRMTTS
jgi:hypothetical protein